VDVQTAVGGGCVIHVDQGKESLPVSPLINWKDRQSGGASGRGRKSKKAVMETHDALKALIVRDSYYLFSRILSLNVFEYVARLNGAGHPRDISPATF
jgi:hypothetical protein